MKRRARKTKDRRGFSLVETLIAMLILSIMTGLAGMGVTQALSQRAKSIALADAQTVASNAAQLVADQLRYGQIAQVDSDGTILYASGSYGAPVALGLDSAGRLTAWGVTTSGGGTVQRAATGYSLLGEDAYCGLCLSGLEFTLDRSGDQVRAVRVSLTVSTPGESDSLWSLDFSVSPINQQVFTLV